jgi:hypothetical protein
MTWFGKLVLSLMLLTRHNHSINIEQSKVSASPHVAWLFLMSTDWSLSECSILSTESRLDTNFVTQYPARLRVRLYQSVPVCFNGPKILSNC